MATAAKTRLTVVLLAYCLAVAGAAAGIVVRVAFHFPGEREVGPYHCYAWNPHAATYLMVFVVVVPAAAAFVPGRTRVISLLIITLFALVLATFAWSFTKIVSCSPM